ncbi:MAG: sulfotransferase [Phycisphaeraceae bacterium]
MPDTCPIFISARVRSGSTLLWQIYDRLPGYRAYYQPCQDNLLPHIRHTRPMASHRGVDDYWSAFRPLVGELPRYHEPAFGITRLMLEADEPWPALRDYLQLLIDNCDGERPVLQFNAMCYRLPWLRRNFPDAQIMHLWRDPREHWLSVVRHLPSGLWDEPNLPDAYNVLQTCADLSRYLPLLFSGGDTSYARVYHLWRLSRLAGDRVADASIQFDGDILADPARGLGTLAQLGLLREQDLPAARACIAPTPTGKWREHHDPAWFEAIEQACEAQLTALGLTEHFGTLPLSAIRARCPQTWDEMQATAPGLDEAMTQMLLAYSERRGECTRLLDAVRRAGGGDRWWGQLARRLRLRA